MAGSSPTSMSESERETHPAGDIATRTPPEGEQPVPHQAEQPVPQQFEPAVPPQQENGNGNAPVVPLARAAEPPDEPRPRVRIRKLRVIGVLLGLSVLAVVSTIFGMMMAVTSDLPALEEPAGKNSVLTDRNGEPLGMLTGNQKRIFLKSEEIAPVMKQAIIAIEDRRFYTNAGIDLRGIGRALYQDVRAQDAVQGGSTITMQFVKIATAAEGERTLFNKLREAALAYQITRKWSKERILRNYLNAIYFGNGAYGIEGAARSYSSAWSSRATSRTPSSRRRSRPRCRRAGTSARRSRTRATRTSRRGS